MPNQLGVSTCIDPCGGYEGSSDAKAKAKASITATAKAKVNIDIPSSPTCPTLNTMQSSLEVRATPKAKHVAQARVKAGRRTLLDEMAR